MIPTVATPKEESRHTHDLEPDIEDDASTKFYKARLRRRSSFTGGNASTIYNFDTWSREHYGASFERRKAAKEKFERYQIRNRENTLMVQNEIILFSVIVVICVMTYLKFLAESAYDTPKQTSNSDQNHQRQAPEATEWMNDLDIVYMERRIKC